MEFNTNRKLIALTQFGQYLKNALEFCILQEGVKIVHQIKWNIQWIDLAYLSAKPEGSKVFFLEVVIVLNSVWLDPNEVILIHRILNKYFDAEPEQPMFLEVGKEIIYISKVADPQKERFQLNENGRGVPNEYRGLQVTVSLESKLRDSLQDAKLILSSDDMLSEERKLIQELIEERSNIQAKLNEIQKPIVVCEGKTDMKIVEISWKKLYPDEEMPFQIVPSGVWLDVEESIGNADHVRRLLELYSPIASDKKICIGLFDNDMEGNNQFKGLDKKLFELIESQILKKHKSKSIYGLLLPIPTFRSEYFGESLAHRFFSIEHYFSNEVLEKNNMKGETITPDSKIFRISGGKEKFTKQLGTLDKNEFKNFEILFIELAKIISR